MLWCTVTETIVREIHELKDNSLLESIDSENTGKHLRLFYNYGSMSQWKTVAIGC